MVPATVLANYKAFQSHLTSLAAVDVNSFLGVVLMPTVVYQKGSLWLQENLIQKTLAGEGFNLDRLFAILRAEKPDTRGNRPRDLPGKFLLPSGLKEDCVTPKSKTGVSLELPPTPLDCLIVWRHCSCHPLLSLVPHVGYPWSPVGRFLHPHSHQNHLVAPSQDLPIGLLVRRSLLPALSVYPSQSPVAPAPCKTPVVSEHFECIPYIGVGTAIGGHNQVDPATTSHTSVTLVS